MLTVCLGLAVLLIMSFYLFNRDFFSISFLLLLGYFISSIFAVFNTQKWGIDIYWLSMVIWFLGWIAFILGELFIKKLVYRNKWCYKQESVEFGEIKVQSFVVITFIILNILITFLLYREVIKIANIGGVLDNGLIARYKENALDNSMSGVVIQLLKITKGSAYVCTAIFCNNIIAGNKNKKYIIGQSLLLISGFIYCTQCIIKGGRFNVIAYIVSILFYSFFILQYTHSWGYKVLMKTFIKIVMIAMVIVYAFWFYKEVVGRTSNAIFFDYISQYVGGPYELFNQYVKNGAIVNGNETFAGLIESMNKILGTNISNLGYHEFRFTSTGIMLGNAYSGIRNYYADYGLFGVGISCFFYAAFFSIIFCQLAKTQNIYRNFFKFVFLGSIMYCLLFHFFSDYFIARISMGYIIELLVMYICYEFIVRIKFKFGKD